MALCRIELLGSLRAEMDGRCIARFQTHKAGALLAYLAYSRDRLHPREIVLEILWPEEEPEVARHKLSVALSSLRRQLEPPGIAAGSVIQASRTSVGLNPGAVITDVAEFEAAYQAARGAGTTAQRIELLIDTVESYRGPLLPGYYESWIVPEQQRLSDLFFQAVRQLTGDLEAAGDLPRSIDYAARGVAADPLREEACRVLMRLYAAAGQPEAALRQYRALEGALQRELGEAPSDRTRQLAREIEQERSSLPSPNPPVARSSDPDPASALSTEMEAGAAPGRLLPTGTVTFLMTDIQGSTAAWERGGQAYGTARAAHHELLRREFARHGGCEVKEMGDSFVVAFAGAADAVAAAMAARRALAGHAWPVETGPLPVRMALHTGDVEIEKGEYQGLALHRAARVLAAVHGGQIVCTEVTAGLLRRAAPGSVDPDVQLWDLGLYELRGLSAPERLFQVGDAAMPRKEFPPLQARRAPEAALPVPLTRFFGREEDLRQLQELLAAPAGPREAAHRLVTLTGPSGSGKTRLALELAQRLRPTFQGAVWLVTLADVPDAAFLWERVLDAMGATRSPGMEPREQAVQALAGRSADQPLLLVLDNLEHLVEEGADLVEWLLQRVPAMACLVTSRQRLGIAGEREYPVPPLPIPGVEELPERLLQNESVRLFVDRAQAARTDFQVTARNAGAIAGLCIRLEGLPLALELAAAWALVMTPDRMLAQLERRFEFLVSRTRGVPARHRSLRAALEWSDELLSPALRQFAARLSVFRGGGTAEAAAAVCEAGEERPDRDSGQRRGPGPGRALEYPARLVECSRVLAMPAGSEMRFGMLETLREYGAEQLPASDRTALARRHAFYFLALAEEAEPELRGPLHKAWLERLWAEEENLRAAMRWAEESGEAQIGLRLGGALRWFWTTRYSGEAREQLERLLELDAAATRHSEPEIGPAQEPVDEPPNPSSSAPDPRTVRAKALHTTALLALGSAHCAAAAARAEEGLALYRELGERAAAGSLLRIRAEALLRVGQPDVARSLIEADAWTQGELGEGREEAEALACTAQMALAHGEYATSRALYEQSLEIYRSLGDQQGAAYALVSLGQVVQHQGELETARRLHEESLALYTELEAQEGVAWVRLNLGHLARYQGDFETARSAYEQVRASALRAGHQAKVGWAVHHLGLVAMESGDLAHARPLLEEAQREFEGSGDLEGIAHSHLRLGRLWVLQRDVQAAKAHYERALTLFQALKDRWAMAFSLEGFAGLAVAQSQAERAARLFGAAAALRERLGTPLMPAERVVWEQEVAAARAALGEPAFTAAWEQGRAMALDEAVAFALGEGAP